MTIDWGNSDQMYWHGDTEEARFSVDWNGRKILCRVAREALEDNCRNPKTEEACLHAAKENFDHLINQIGHKIAVGMIEEDGSVLLRSFEW